MLGLDLVKLPPHVGGDALTSAKVIALEIADALVHVFDRAGIGLAALVPLPEGQMLAMDAPDGHLPDLGGMLHPAEFPSGLDVVRCGGEGLDDGPEDA